MKNEIETIITEEDIRKRIYVLDGKEVMLDSDLAAFKCHKYIYDDMITHYDIGIPISVFINYRDVSAKLERN